MIVGFLNIRFFIGAYLACFVNEVFDCVNVVFSSLDPGVVVGSPWYLIDVFECGYLCCIIEAVGVGHRHKLIIGPYNEHDRGLYVSNAVNRCP